METMKIEYKINGIELIEKHLNRFENLPPSVQFNFQVSSQTIFTKEPLRLLVVFTSIEINIVGSPKVLGKFFIAMGFEILNPEVIFKDEPEPKIIFPLEVENHFKSLAISTSRGIVFSELRGTPLHNAILPILDMKIFKPIEGNLVEAPKDVKRPN